MRLMSIAYARLIGTYLLPRLCTKPAIQQLREAMQAFKYHDVKGTSMVHALSAGHIKVVVFLAHTAGLHATIANAVSTP